MLYARYRYFLLFVFVILSWGLAWPINKIGLQYMSPAWYTMARLVIGTTVMFLLVAMLGKLSFPKAKEWVLISVIGFLQISLYILLANYGLLYIPAGRASILAYTTPIWIMPFTIFIFGEKAGRLHWLGFILGITGIIFLIDPLAMDWKSANTLLGSFILLLASLSWAISILCARYMHWSKSTLELMPWQLIVGTLPVLVWGVITEPVAHVEMNLPLILSLLYTGVLVTGFSYWAGLVINRELPSIVVSMGFLAAPVFSLLISTLYMGETIGLFTQIAMILILGGLVCLVWEKRTS